MYTKMLRENTAKVKASNYTIVSNVIELLKTMGLGDEQCAEVQFALSTIIDGYDEALSKSYDLIDKLKGQLETIDNLFK